MIIPGPEVTMATAWLSHPLRPPSPILYRLDTTISYRVTESCGIISQKQKLTAQEALCSDSRLRLTLQTTQRMFLKPLVLPADQMSVFAGTKREKLAAWATEMRQRKKKGKQCQIAPLLLPNPAG